MGVWVWARRTICITVKLKPGLWVGPAFLTSVLSPTAAPTDTWCLTAHGAGPRPGPGVGAQYEPESPLELRPVGSLASLTWEETHSMLFS